MAEEAGRTAPEAEEYGQRIRVIAGQEILFDGEDFLWDPRQWSEEVAEALAKEAGQTEMNKTQWMILRFLREYYFENGRAPLNRQIKQGTGISLMEMEALFPGGIKYGARRLAGLPNPKNCN
jgi:dissimilatory sulfite reductase related protein